MNVKTIILAARIISMLLTPFYLSVVGVLAIFSFSYLSMFPWQAKLSLVLLTYAFTVLIPSILIHLYRQYHGWTLFQLGHREKRMIPYVISILCYSLCLYIMDWLHASSSPYRYPYGSFSDTDTLCHYQCLVENIHPYSSYWWSNRVFNRFFFPFQLQSYVVVVPCNFALGLGRIEPNYPPTTLSFASVYGVFPRYS